MTFSICQFCIVNKILIKTTPLAKIIILMLNEACIVELNIDLSTETIGNMIDLLWCQMMHADSIRPLYGCNKSIDVLVLYLFYD